MAGYDHLTSSHHQLWSRHLIISPVVISLRWWTFVGLSICNIWNLQCSCNVGGHDEALSPGLCRVAEGFSYFKNFEILLSEFHQVSLSCCLPCLTAVDSLQIFKRTPQHIAENCTLVDENNIFSCHVFHELWPLFLFTMYSFLLHLRFAHIFHCLLDNDQLY